MLETKYEDIEIIDKVSSVEEAMEVLKNVSPDILFLDIRLENGIGFDLLDQYSGKKMATVIVSGYDQYGITALKYGVVDYILKPIHADDLDAAVNKAKLFVTKQEVKPNHLQGGVDKLKISTFNGFSLIEIKDIVRLESDSNYTNVFLADGNKLVVSKTMKEFEPYLDELSFFRVHRSHIINVNCIKGYNSKDGGYAVLKDETMIEISRSKHKEFMDFISRKFNSIS
jgi:two-component system LytT family response regulator